MKKFIGYFIIGASSEYEAKNEKGMLLWSQKKPNAIVRFFNRVLLKIYWVDKERVLEEKGKRTHAVNPDIEFIRTSPGRDNRYQHPVTTDKAFPPHKKKRKYDDNPNQARFNSRRGFDPSKG